jgi:hypothetical protein
VFHPLADVDVGFRGKNPGNLMKIGGEEDGTN